MFTRWELKERAESYFKKNPEIYREYLENMDSENWCLEGYRRQPMGDINDILSQCGGQELADTLRLSKDENGKDFNFGRKYFVYVGKHDFDLISTDNNNYNEVLSESKNQYFYEEILNHGLRGDDDYINLLQELYEETFYN